MYTKRSLGVVCNASIDSLSLSYPYYLCSLTRESRLSPSQIRITSLSPLWRHFSHLPLARQISFHFLSASNWYRGLSLQVQHWRHSCLDIGGRLILVYNRNARLMHSREESEFTNPLRKQPFEQFKTRSPIVSRDKI